MALLIGLLTVSGPAIADEAPAPPKVLRYAIKSAESGFDPAQVSDFYSRNLCAGFFEPLLRYEYLARPITLAADTASALPEVSADFKTYTFHLQPGIYFADDPAFKGKKRELTAADYVYTIERHYDPATKSGQLYQYENAGILGLSELRRALMAAHKPFDYDRPVEGVRALDRYTLQVRVAHANPRFINQFADVSLGAVAREVVEFYGDKIMAHPVGTGPFVLADWRRSSRIVLEKNPTYRERYYDEHPPADDARLVAQANKLRGLRLPLVDRVEVSVIEENQPRWLSFLSREADFLDEVPPDFATLAMPHNRLAPYLAKQGIQMERYARDDVVYSYFAMHDPVVGGYSPAHVALRRAIALGVNVEREISAVRRGQAVPAQSVVGPSVWGFDPAFKSAMSEYDPAKARALLDLYGYVDRDGDGWREQPDGSPLLIEYATQSNGEYRQLAEQWQKNMTAIGIHMVFKMAQFPENLKASRAGKLMMWNAGWTASIPDADDFLALAYGPNKGQSNHPRFDLPAYNQLYEQQRATANGPERQALINEMQRLLVAYMPYKVSVNRIFTDMYWPWVVGYQRNLFVRDFWTYVDIDTAQLNAKH